ncbi:TonB-dependent Receptor Plug Domain protein [Enhygromyxa salina]|uniref:TonB-dependent Receptor Plug Domain protein n=1 Tax=Enhygromyxa salina TaxID=215803 RepID=A0A2S9YEL5_9BACT|nr:TonB-dependent receptor [Enhygromyxa salina]PRQ03555.1 TonB-dependent Receptor Plug Domain protein [Enhygromyxa salina]
MLGLAILLGGLVLGPPPPDLPPDLPSAPPPEAQLDPDPDAEPEPEPGPATHGQLRVQVLVHGGRDTVAGARLFELGAPDPPDEPAETDERGVAQLWLEPGSHRFSARADGYEPLEFEVEITLGERQTLELRIDEALGGSRYRTVVSSERTIAVSRTTLREQEIHELPGSGGDPFSVIKSLPGAAQVTGFLPYVVVRGAAPGNTGYYLDGVRVPALFHVAVGPSVVHPYFIDQVDFYPGGVPVRLGRYASGIVEGRTRAAARDRVRGEVDLRLTDAGALLELPFDRPRDQACEAELAATEAEAGTTPARAARRAKLACRAPGRGSLTLGGRYSYTGLILSAVPGLNVKMRFWDYQARLDHELGPRARYTAFVFGSYDELGQREALVEVDDEDGVAGTVLDPDPDPFVRLEFHRIDQRIRQRVRNGGRVDYRVALGLDRSGVQSIRVDQWRVAPRIDAQLKLGERLTLRAGLDQEFQVFRLPRGLGSGELTNSIEDLALLLSERFVSVTGLYADLGYRKGAFEIRPGVRADLWVQVGSSPYLPGAQTVSSAAGVDPRVLVREQVGAKLALRQSFGVYHQPPDPPLPIPGIESIGLEDGLQRNTQASFGWEWTIGDRAVLTQDAYLGRLANMQDYELSEGLGDTGDASTADELDDYVIRVSGWSWGLETMLRLVPDGKAYGWLAYTLSWSYRDYPLGGFAPATWDQRHIFNAVLGWNINRKWRLGGRFHLNSGRPYTTRQVDGSGSLESLIEALTEHRNDARLSPFLQLDVRVERVFTLRDFRLHLYLDLANANFGREVLRCDSLAESTNPAVQVVDGCVNPQAVRYILPALGLRAVF